MKGVRGQVGGGRLRRRNCDDIGLWANCVFGVLLGFVLGGCSVVVWCCGGGDLELLVSGAFGLWS